jgi:hypothetical protein
MKKAVFFFMAILLATGNSFLFSQSVQKDIQAQLIIKIIGLDRNFARYGDPIKIGVSSQAMERALKRFSKRTIREREYVPEMMSSIDDIERYHIIYIDKNWKENYKAACDKAVEKKILMFSADDDAVEKGEAGIAFKTILGATKIVINREVIKKQGSDFPAGFLQVARVVGNL